MTQTPFHNANTTTDRTESPMFGHDLRTREYLATRARESDRERHHQALVAESGHRIADAADAAHHASLANRARVRVGEGFVALGVAIGGHQPISGRKPLTRP